MLLRSFEKAMSFVHHHLPYTLPSAGSASSNNSVSAAVHHEVDIAAASTSSVTSDNSPPYFVKLDELIILEMHQMLSRMLKEINAGVEVSLEMTVYQLLDKLNNHHYMHIMYAIANNFRRLW